MDHPRSSRRRLLSGVSLRTSYVHLAMILALIILGLGARSIQASTLITLGLSPANNPIIEGNSGSFVAGFTVKLSQAVGPGQQVVIRMSTIALPPGPNSATQGNKATDPNADYNSTPVTLIFNPGDAQKVFPVTIYGDTLDELNEGFTVNATVTASSVPGIAVGDIFESTGIIIDDDNPTVQSISAPTATETIDPTIDFVVTLDKASTIGEDISIAYQTVDGTAIGGVDFPNITFGSLLIPAGSTTGVIKIPLIDTLVNKPTTTFQIKLLEASSLSANTPFVQTLATGTILDENDEPLVDADSTALGIDGTAKFTQTTPPASNPVAIAPNLTLSDPEGDQITSAVVSITNLVDPVAEVLDVNVGATGITKNFAAGVLTLTGPTTATAMETVLRTLTYGNSSQTPGVSRTISIVATDNGAPPGPATTNPAARIVVTINSLAPGAVDDSATVLEDVATSIDVLSNDSGGGGGVKNIAGVNTTGTHGTVKFTATSLTYQSNPNYCNNGTPTDTFTYSLNGGSTATVFVTVTCVNDPPSLTPGTDVTVAEDSGPYSSLWFTPTTILAGPGETGQTPFTITTSNDNNALFSVQPSVDVTTGILTFTPAPNANGSVIVTVILQDSGGTANNGIDTTSYIFTLTITPVDDPATIKSNGLTVDEGGTGVITQSDLDASDVDTPLLDLTFTLSTTPVNGQLRKSGGTSLVTILTKGATFRQSDINNGRVTYIHDNTNTITDSFTFTMNDGTPGTFTITINPVNDPPVLTITTGSDSYLLGDPPVVIDPGATVEDGDSPFFGNGKLKVTLTNSGPGDTLNIRSQGNGPGQISTSIGSSVLFGGTQIGTITTKTVTPPVLEITFNGKASLAAVQALTQNITFSNTTAPTTPGSRIATFVVNDGFLDSAEHSKTITFNQSPIAVDDTATMTMNTTATPISVLSNDSDADGDTLFITGVTPGSHGTTAVGLTGTDVTYTPDFNYLGTDSFTYTISDGKASATGTVTITTHKTFVFLPVLSNPVYADLIVSFAVSPTEPTAGQRTSITVTVTNVGGDSASNFWTDFYIDPAAVPQVNDRWNDLCRPAPTFGKAPPCYGLAWYYAGTLAPGQSVVLNSRPQSVDNPNGYMENYSTWHGYFYNGVTTLYAYVDSWNQDANGQNRNPDGAVYEKSNESNNRAFQTITVLPGKMP